MIDDSFDLRFPLPCYQHKAKKIKSYKTLRWTHQEREREREREREKERERERER